MGEAEAFPEGPHDDQVDAAAGGFNALPKSSAQQMISAGGSRTFAPSEDKVRIITGVNPTTTPSKVGSGRFRSGERFRAER